MNSKGLMWAFKSEKKKFQLLKSDCCVQDMGERGGAGKNLLQFQERCSGTQQNSDVLTCLKHFLGCNNLMLSSRWGSVHTGLPSAWQQWAPLGSLSISQFWLLNQPPPLLSAWTQQGPAVTDRFLHAQSIQRSSYFA